MNGVKPRNLEEAIRIGLLTGLLKDAEKNVYSYVKEFIGSRIVESMAFQDEKTVGLLEDLFLNIIIKSDER